MKSLKGVILAFLLSAYLNFDFQRYQQVSF